jgi:hypothetical protein
MSRDFRGPRPHPFALAIIAFAALLPGCGGSKDATLTIRAPVLAGAERQPKLARAAARSGGLAVTLKATPARVRIGTPIEFDLTAYAPHPAGAFNYQLRYGDGTNATQITVPLTCIEGRSAPMRQTWHLTHRYKSAGQYRVSVSLYVNCTSDHATATAMVTVG